MPVPAAFWGISHMKFVYFIGFILVLLPVLVLGHDLYLALYIDGEIDISQPVKFSDLGWLWVTYGPETYDWAKSAMANEDWDAYMSPVLRQNALLATGIPAAIFLAAFGFFKLLGLRKLIGGKAKNKSKSGYTFGEEKSKGAYQYKRK